MLPILRNQPGFVDEIGLSNTKCDQVVAVSFWNTKEDAARYNQEQFPQLINKLLPLLKMPPRVQTFTVESSTVHKIAAGQAA